jgi:arabinolytic transcriptional activator AraR
MGSKKIARRRTPASAPCPECGRAFSRNDSLSRHLKTHLHAEQRPYHRIINEKFRACNRCRQSKIRCTGNVPCARCEQLKEECSYEKSRDEARTLTWRHSSGTASMTEEPRPIASSPSSPSKTPTIGDQPIDQPSHDEVGKNKHVAKTRGEEMEMALVSPKSTTGMLHLALSASPEARTVLFNDGKDFSAVPSTYVSPTFHILDPYSYRLPSIADSREARTPTSQAFAQCKYPVLHYLSPFLDKDFGSTLACDLLDTYFSSAFLSRMHPTCHHIHNFIIRKIDILDPHQPRQTHPALLSSMLFVAAFSDKALGLFSGPEEKDRVCKYLSLLTYRLLNPSRYEPLLRQEDLGLPPPFSSDTGWSNDDLRRALDSHSSGFPVSWGVDYIIAFIHVSSVISGSEKKAASTRW